MKIIKFFIQTCLLFSLTSCWDKVDPEVSTVYITNGDREAQRAAAVNTLLDHYQSSTKDKPFYEVISKGKGDGRFILNYNRVNQLLTLCADPGSGWFHQFKEIKETTLENLVSKGATFDDLERGTPTDSISNPNDDPNTLIVKGVELKFTTDSEWVTPKTNGDPSL